ncbi:hypothetical protein [Otoolea muris]|uniref:hypothetical protein n=1 Tax=Otoolea muris TaxID=2941515 RepID=UPI00203B2CEC|nr:hypothetical protein [Otoolea muris]
MSNLSYKDILLSFSEHIILIKIRFFGASSKYALSDNRRFLRRYGLVELSPHFKNRYRLSDNGKMYLRYRFHSFWKFAIPTIISVIALFGGYDVYTNPVLKELLEAIASLFAHIMEILGIG